LPNRRCLSEDRGDDAMNDPTMETLERRLDRVERENRWLKRAGVVALGMIAAVGLMGQATESKVAKVIEAETFVVRDSSGNIRAVLENVVGQGASLVFRGTDGMEQIALQSFGNSRGFTLSDKSGNGRAALTLEADGSIALALYDEKSKSHVKLLAGRDGNPGIVLQDKDKGVRLRLLLYSDGSPAMVLFDNNGKVIWSVP